MHMKRSKSTIKFEKYLKSIGGLYNGFKYYPYAWSYFKILGKRFTVRSVSSLKFDLFKYLGYADSENPFRAKIYSRYSFSVGDGWLPLVQDLIEKSIKLGWNKQLCQAKEKYGGLRFYINGASDEIHDLIEKFEDASFEICEECGSRDGVTQTDGWIYTYCKKCMENYKMEFKMKYKYFPLSKEQYRAIKVGDVIERMLCFAIPVYLNVIAVTDTIIDCGWTFDRDTGLEIDKDITTTASYISKVLTEEEKKIVSSGGKI